MTDMLFSSGCLAHVRLQSYLHAELQLRLQGFDLILEQILTAAGLKEREETDIKKRLENILQRNGITQRLVSLFSIPYLSQRKVRYVLVALESLKSNSKHIRYFYTNQ